MLISDPGPRSLRVQVVQTTQQKQRDQEMSTELVNDLTGSRLSFNGYRQRRKIDEWSTMTLTTGLGGMKSPVLTSY